MGSQDEKLSIDYRSRMIYYVVAALIFIAFTATAFFQGNSLAVRNNALSSNNDASQSAKLQNKQYAKTPGRTSFDKSNYPKFDTLLNVVSRWNPDNPEVPVPFQETLQHFDYSNPVERAMAEVYRNAEVPFKLYNVPEFDEVSAKWTDEYLSKELKHARSSVERSESNHFMYYKKGKRIKDYVPPTTTVNMTFGNWLHIARQADINKLESNKVHYSFITGSSVSEYHFGSNFIAKNLTLLSTSNPNYFITNPSMNKGIQCRFGMRGIIAESHYDGSRNMIVMLKGSKRYILNPPRACKNLGIISDSKHPSFSYSKLDWSDITQAKAHGFDAVDAIDTVVRQGEVLYIPSFWFHYIVSIDYSISCSGGSGPPESMVGESDIISCGASRGHRGINYEPSNKLRYVKIPKPNKIEA